MKPNEIKPEAYENKPAVSPEKVAGTECIDMCKIQYYCPQPILCARLAHAYVPFQCLCCLYPPEKGLQQGTIFPELDRPYGMDP
jgi:hypothetical protein